MGDLEPASAAEVAAQERAAEALQLWYRHGGYHQVCKQLDVSMEAAVNLVDEGRRRFELTVMRDVEGQRLQTALELSETNELLLGHLRAVKGSEHGVRALDLRVAEAQQRTRERLNEVTGVRERHDAGPSVIVLQTGFDGSAADALSAQKLRAGDALVIETRAPWDRPDVVDGEAEEVTGDEDDVDAGG